MSIEEQIAKLVDRYEGLDVRHLRQFNEENTKKDFILPLFRHLGWDVTNSDEVAAEEKSSSGRVDYAFKIGGVSKFYLEAKPLREDLTQRPDWAKQVITYAENKGVTWAVLTNFKQLMVFNAEWDEPALERARFLNLTYQQYLPAFHKLWWLSRDSVEKGVLDEEARQVGALKPKLPVEKSLLDQLLRWRKELFNQIYQHNRDRGLDLYQVDELIQQFINRLIFIRSTEDRGIEENRLRAALHQWRDSGRKGELVESMRAIFHEFATLYDSDLFPLLDTWDSIFVESDTIERIIEGSYERPTRLAGYDFAAIDPKVLGAIYEQYLGYVAQEAKKRATEQARLLGFEAPTFELEARRIKRKQQGIYYTPEFVVDYIVKETVGRFIKEHSYNDIFNIKILDPACGSGSFLIRAYDELLHYHAREKGKSPAELEHWERVSILLGNIFGVDLDRQAVEITRLSLLLSCVAEREILPSLADNIREGNSLISGTEEELRHYFGDEWRDKKRLNWEEEFKDIMANGGFDVVIGNPPYVRLGSLPAQERSFYGDFFKSASKQYDIYVLFIEKGINLLKDDGRLGFITSSKFFASDYGKQIRKYILQNCCIEKVIDVSNIPVFKDAAIYPFIFILRKESDPAKRKANVVETVTGLATEEEFSVAKYKSNFIPQARFETTDRYAFDVTLVSPDIIDKVEGKSFHIGSIFRITRGFRPPPNDLLISKVNFDQLGVQEQGEYRKLVIGKDLVGPYALDWGGVYIRYEPNRIYEAKPKEVFEYPKIMIADISYHPKAYYDLDGFYCLKTIYLILKDKEAKYDLAYVTGILNSKLIDFFFRSRFSAMHMQGGYLRFRKQFVEQLPIRRIDFDNPTDKKMHDDLVALVERMLELNKCLAPIRNTSFSERDELIREIERTDAEIDQKVYELYGITEEERQVIEASL